MAGKEKFHGGHFPKLPPPAIAQIEKPDSKTQRKTLGKIALAMNLDDQQITD